MMTSFHFYVWYAIIDQKQIQKKLIYDILGLMGLACPV